MEIEEVDINLLKPMEGNPRKISQKESEDIKKSIEKFGDVQVLVVNKNNVVIGGNQRIGILKEMGYKTVKIARMNLSEKNAKILNISLNKTGGVFDELLLPDFLEGIDINELIGFTEGELKEIKLDLDFSDFLKEENNLEEGKKNEVSWSAKFDNKEYEKIKKIIQKLKTKNKFGNFSSEYANGLVLKKLCEGWEKLTGQISKKL